MKKALVFLLVSGLIFMFCGIAHADITKRLLNRSFTSDDVEELSKEQGKEVVIYDKKLVGVEHYRQDYSWSVGWCADACMQSILGYYGHKVEEYPQCLLVEWKREEFKCGNHYSTSFDCCPENEEEMENPSNEYLSACNSSCTNSDKAQVAILKNFGIEADLCKAEERPETEYLNVEEIKHEIENGRPFLILLKYFDIYSPGHMVVGYGIKQSILDSETRTILYVRDPSSPNENAFLSYDEDLLVENIETQGKEGGRYWWGTILLTTDPPPPSAPTLAVTTSGTTVTLSWTTVSNVTGYTLYFAPYPAGSPIGNIDMKTQTNKSATLEEGASFYVAVQAYNGSETSDISNVEHFVLSSSPTTSYYEVYGFLDPCISGELDISVLPLLGTSNQGNVFDVSGFSRFVIHVPATSPKILFDAIQLDNQWVDSFPGCEGSHVSYYFNTTSGSFDNAIEGPPDSVTIENVVGRDASYSFSTLGASKMTVYIVN